MKYVFSINIEHKKCIFYHKHIFEIKKYLMYLLYIYCMLKIFY
jgi:hypothetical protein